MTSVKQQAVLPREEVSLQIELLGQFRISDGSRTITEAGWRLRKARSLVKLLSLAPNHRLHREQIMAALWPDLDPPAAANNLYQTVHAARKVLDRNAPGEQSHLRLENETLVLCLDRPVWIDVEAFEAAASQARRSRDAAACRAAINLYTGDLLPEDRYEDWASQRREHLRQQYLALLLDLAALYEARGEFTEAVASLQQAVSHEPTYEEAHRRLMWLYAATGHRQQAVRQYEGLKQALRQELDAEPDAQIQRLFQDIAAGRILSPHASASGTTPAPAALAVTIEEAYSKLTETDRTVLRRVAVCEGGFDIDLAAAASVGDGVDRSTITASVARLARDALLIEYHQDGSARYRLPEPVRTFADDRLVQAGEAASARQHHLAWILALAARAEAEMSGPQRAHWLDRLEIEHVNVRAALDFARVNDPDAGARLAGALWQFWEARGRFAEGRAWSEEFLSVAIPSASGTRARVLLGSGALATRQGDHGAAAPLLQESLRLFQESGDRWGTAWALDNLGTLAMSEGNYTEAAALFAQSLSLFQTLGDRRGCGCVLDNLGWAALLQDDLVHAQVHFEESLALFQAIGDKPGIGRALGNLANVARMKGDRKKAQTLFNESVQFCRRNSGPQAPAAWTFRSILRRWMMNPLMLGASPIVLGPITVPCAGVCAAYPLIAVGVRVGSALYTSLLVAHFVLLPLLLVANAVLAVVSFRRHRNLLGPGLSGLGAVLIAIALTEHVLPLRDGVGHVWTLHNLVPPGAILLMTGVLIDWQARRRLAVRR